MLALVDGLASFSLAPPSARLPRKRASDRKQEHCYRRTEEQTEVVLFSARFTDTLMGMIAPLPRLAWNVTICWYCEQASCYHAYWAGLVSSDSL